MNQINIKKVALLIAAGTGMRADAVRYLSQNDFNISILSSSGKGEKLANVLPDFIGSLPEKKEFKSRIPLNRYGKVREVSNLILFLASDKSSYITGQNIRINGGITKSV